MTEKEKIEIIIKEYKSFFEATDMDVCQSIKGKWYFSKKDSKDNFYECFREFKTAEELIEMILGELALDMACAIEKEVDTADYDHDNLADLLDMRFDYKKVIEELPELLAHFS